MEYSVLAKIRVIFLLVEIQDIAAETQHAIEICKGKTMKSSAAKTQKEEPVHKEQIPKWVTAEGPYDFYCCRLRLQNRSYFRNVKHYR